MDEPSDRKPSQKDPSSQQVPELDPRWHAAAKIFPRMSHAHIQELAEDIKAHGQLQPVVMLGGQVLDGCNRVLACDLLKIAAKTVPFEDVAGGATPVQWVISQNLKRRQLTSSQAAAAAQAALPLLKAEAKERMREGGRKKGRQISADPPDERKATAQAAKQFGTNRPYVEGAARIQEREPSLLEEVRRGDLSIPQALRKLDRPTHEPTKRQEDCFQTIVFEPPWSVTKTGGTKDGPRSNPFNISRYLVSGQDVPRWAAEHCHLYLWTTHKHLHVALDLVRRWGFKYERLLTWVKDSMPEGSDWTDSTEHVIFARQGSLDLIKKGHPLHFHAKDTKDSTKPEAFYALVRDISPEPRLRFSLDGSTHDGFWDSTKRS